MLLVFSMFLKSYGKKTKNKKQMGRSEDFFFFFFFFFEKLKKKKKSAGFFEGRSDYGKQTFFYA